MSSEPHQQVRNSFKPFILIALTTLTALAIIYIMFTQGYRMTAKYSGLISAAMEIKLEATYAHLWFEEIMSGDESESFEQVKVHLSNSIWFARAMLDGGTNQEDVFLPLEETSLRSVIEEVLVELKKLETLTNERYANFVTSHPGSEIDIKYDKTFNRFIILADSAETALKSLVQKDLSGFQRLHYLMAFFVLLIAAVMTLIFWRHERESSEYLRVVQEAQSKLEALSKTDQLTGLSNRRAFDEALSAEFDRAFRNTTPVSLIMIDVDYFKKYNDNYGHPEGDKCLKAVATSIDQLCRRSLDFVSRIGGEEFAVILPYSEQTTSLAKSICEAVEAMGIPHKASDVSDVVTISIGIAEIVPTLDNQPEDLVVMADTALYQAKNGGRNQVV